MATIDYRHLIGGKGRAQGLPVRRGSQLYDVEPRERYPNVLNAGVTQGHQKQWGKAKYHIAPHLPILFKISPYINNHVAGGTFTRTQYFVLKQGQAVMATYKNQPTIGAFGASGAAEDLTYADVGKMASNGIVIGFVKPDGTTRYQLKEGAETGPNPPVIQTQTEYDALSGTPDANAPTQDDYVEIPAVAEVDFETNPNKKPLTLANFAKLTDAEKNGWVAAYDKADLEDSNDMIATGGQNMYAATGKAIFGETDAQEFVEIDADGYYFGQVIESDGFLFPATGGADRVIFYNEVDAEAEVTLPVKGDATDVPFVTPVTHSSLSGFPDTGNQTDWASSASFIEYQPTVGVAHKEFEQSHSNIYHHFQTGTPATGPKQVQKAGELNIPFVDIAKLKDFINNRTPLDYGTDFNFTDEGTNLSGLKTGVYGTGDLDEQLAYSYFTEADSGYANLYHNFGAPFLTYRSYGTTPGDGNGSGELNSRMGIKPDLFGMYTVEDAGFFAPSGTPERGGLTFSTVVSDNRNGDVDMRALGLDKEVIGSVTRIVDIPENSLESLRVNRVWQSRFIGTKSRNWSNEGYRRLGGTADTAGLRPILADFALMLLGGSAYNWASHRYQDYRSMKHDVSNILRDMVRERVIGVAEIYFEAV